MRKKVYSVWLLVVALILGAWTIPSTKNTGVAQPNQDQTSVCDHASTELVGRSAELPRIKGLIHDLCDFRVRMNQIPKNVSEFDKDFIEDSITGNTLELQSLQYSLDRVTNEEWRGQIRMMITMHTADLNMAIAVAKKIGADTTPDLTHASVYPETPDYDLGKRFENLVEEYLDPLMSAGGGVPTAVPSMTATSMPTETATGVPSETATGVPTETATGVPSETATSVPTNTATLVPTDTATAVASETPVVVPTGTSTGTSFDIVSLDIIEDEHVADVQAELAAERLVKNDELRAFAKHSADVTELHIILMGDLKHRLVDNYTPPEPEFQADYQSPRRFQPK